MRLNVVLVRLVEEGQSRNGSSGDELDSEDRVDLADELVANIDGGFRYGTSKLDDG